jgi:hypothetical protein
MPRVIPEDLVEPVLQVLLGATAVGDGRSDEQGSVIDALAVGYWDRPDLDLAALAPLSPAEAGSVIVGDAQRRRVRELLVLLELCRHPLTEEQVELVDGYMEALGGGGMGTEIVRDLVHKGAAAAGADFSRFFGTRAQALSEPTLRAAFADEPSHLDPALGARLAAMHELPPGTLGHAFVDFYRRNGLTLPGESATMPAVFVSHDMCHVIADYEPTAAEEVALGAMQLGVADDENHWVQFLGNLAVHEARYLTAEGPEHGTPALSVPGATTLLAEGLRRGAACTGDFTAADHLAMAARPLEDIRAEFGIPPRVR